MIVRGGRNLFTPHRPPRYPGIAVYDNDGGWPLAVLCLRPGQSFVAHGGEELVAYETPGGVRAGGFRLEAGDRATLVMVEPPHDLAIWRIERAVSWPA